MPQRIVLTPAYGRKYNSKAEILLDWNKGKDFKIRGGPYCSIRDFKQLCSDYDCVILHWISKNSTGHSVTIFEYPLKGITSYG